MDDGPALPIDPDLDPSDPSGPTLAPGRARPHQRRLRPDVLAAIGLGGMVGASARYGVAHWLPTHPGRFPWATFWTNVSGSFLLGLLLVVILDRSPQGRRAEPDSGRSAPPGEEHRPQSAVQRLLRPFAATGVLGAFTTMSTFEVETALLLKDGHALTAVLYLGASLAAGLALAYAGILAGRQITLGRAVPH
jgi:CrcB protein